LEGKRKRNLVFLCVSRVELGDEGVDFRRKWKIGRLDHFCYEREEEVELGLGLDRRNVRVALRAAAHLHIKR